MTSLPRSMLTIGFAAAVWLLVVTSSGSAARAPHTVEVKLRIVGAGTVRVAASRPYTCRSAGGEVCEEKLRFRPDRPLVFRAVAASGWKIEEWQSGCHDSAVTCSLALKARLNVTVKFVRRPPTGLLGSLQAVACVSASDCWAVGERDNWKPQATFTEALHWDGTGWRRVATPSPGGALSGDFSRLSGVTCVSSADCWAIGSYYAASGAAGVIALHWDGTMWRRTPIPGGGADSLKAVACASAGFCFLVGAETPPQANGNLVLRWNGTSWQRVTVPEPSGTTGSADYSLNSVACTSTTNCWAVGGQSPSKDQPVRNQVLRWNGTSWEKVGVPNPSGTRAVSDLNGVACAAASYCFAVGGHAGYKTLLWNGTVWKTTPINPGGSGGSRILNAVVCPAAANCWAVGNDNEALHWNGRSWEHEKTPNPAGNASHAFRVLDGIACTFAHSCWAVGSYGDEPVDRPETLHWNGTHWSRTKN